MTDVEKPYGTKRRGSTEMKTEELQIPSDITPNISASSEEPEPSPSPAPDIVPDIIPSKAPTKKIASLQQPPNGHRRRNTDGNINFAPSGTKFFKKATSKQVIEMMQSELPPSARLDMQQKANYLKLERELKHAQIKLREAEDQCSTAVEIIGNLQRENEDLAVREEMLRTQLGAVSTELKISEQKVQSLEDLYRTETAKYKEEAESVKKQLNELQDDMNQKDMQLNQAKEYQQSIQQQLQQQTSVNDQDEYVDKMIAKTKREKQLTAQIQELQQQLMDKDNKLENLLSKIEHANVWQHEKENLQKELNQMNAMAQQDIMFQKEQMEKMTRELIMLGSRNSALEKERDDLMTLLEERDYENQMLKTGYGLHRNKTSRNHTQLENFASQLGDVDTDAEYDETLENLEFMDQTSYRVQDEYENSEEYENVAAGQSRESRSSSPKHKQRPPQREVVDVVREYLNLTASVVNMKFPRITHISSEELINKVKNYQFFEYHDMMVRIMKTEEQKLVAKQKAEQEAKATKANGANAAQPQQTGMLSRFRNFFGGGTSPANNNNGGGRRRTVDNGSQQQSSQRRRTVDTGSQQQQQQQRKGSTIDKKAPSPPTNNFDVNKAKADVKKKALAFGKKAKDVKEITVSKITGNPTEKEKDKMADMSFVGVPFVGAPKSDDDVDDDDDATSSSTVKPDKPAQKL